MNTVKKHEIYPHRLVILCPRLVNENTPPKIKRWLELIEDSLDGKLEESKYTDKMFTAILNTIHRPNIDRDLLSQIKDEAAWENVKRRQREEGFEEGEKQARLDTDQKMLADGLPIEMVLKYTGLTHTDLEEGAQ